MGKLSIIEVENFKSYCGKHLIGPFDDFTCVIGPNGAGKSNLMDAISFVLGVQSRQLRSSHLKELLYRKDISSQPAKKGYVKLVYKLSNDEIIENYVDEINFTRTISGNGNSTYKIDNKEVSYEQYESTLQKIGILIKARNFLVFQGDVESVASKSPIELTKLLEQICGSDVLKDEYDKLLQLKDDAEEKAINSMQKRKLIQTQTKEIKEQKDEAELFQQKRQELDELKSQHILWQLWKIKKSIDEYQDTANELKAELSQIKQNTAIENEMEEGKKVLAKLSKSILTTDKELSVKNKQIQNTIIPRVDEIRAKLKGFKKRLAELEVSELNMKKDFKEQQTNVTGLQNDIQLIERAESKLASDIEIEASKAGPNMDAKKVEEYRRLREEVAGKTAAENAELQTIESDIKSKHLRIERMTAQEVALKQEIDGETKLLSEYTERSEKLKAAISDGQKDKVRLENDRDTTVSDMRKYEQNLIKLTQELEEVTLKLREAGEDRRRGKREESMNEAIENMQRIFTGVYGRLTDLFQPIQKKYSTAILTASGKYLDAIVVSNKKVASECIQYLKDHRIGTCIILPLDGIAVKPIPDKLRLLGNKYKLCADLIECEDNVKHAVLFALGSTIVCETLSDAQDLRFTKNESVKVVTIKGHVISKQGTMTGGVSSTQGIDRWEEKEYDKLRKRKSEIEDEMSLNKSKAPTRQQLIDIETHLKTLQTRIAFSEADLKVTLDKLNSLKTRKDSMVKSMKNLVDELNGIKHEVSQSEIRSKELSESIKNIESEIFGPFSKAMGVNSIREFEEEKYQTHQKFMKKKSLLAEQRAALESQLQYELKRDFEGNLSRVQTQRKDTEKELKMLEEQEHACMLEEEHLRKEVKKDSDKLKELNDSKLNISNSFKKLQSEHATVAERRDAITKKLSGQEILIERARVNLHEILQKAHVDEITLPYLKSEDVENDSTEESSHESRSGTSRSSRETRATTSSSYVFSQTDNSEIAKDQRSAAKIDLSSMDKYENSKYSKHDLSNIEANIQKSITSLANELETMQPNMHAVKQYDTLVDKLKECSDDLEGAKDDKKEIALNFENIKKQRQTLFQNCFQHIHDSLAVIYKDLTKSTKYPYGGSAYLTLDNTVEPYLGGVRFTAMPPMKRFRDMDQLSGGEKTIAALALLFSIHSYRQAPFFVMDEIDAALDNINVKKVCNYIRQRSHNFQCIVISLKDIFFEHADALVGVCKDIDALSSRIHTLRLSEFDNITTAPAKLASAEESDISAIAKHHDSSPSTVSEDNQSGDEGNVQEQDEKSVHDRKRKTKDAGFKKKSQQRRAQASIPEEDEEND